MKTEYVVVMTRILAWLVIGAAVWALASQNLGFEVRLMGSAGFAITAISLAIRIESRATEVED